MNSEFFDTDGPALDPSQRKYLESLMKNIETCIELCHEPLDAKVLGLLEITHDIIDQQLKLDIYHEWGATMELDQAISNKEKTKKFLFIDEDNEDTIPTKEELEGWFGD